MKLGEKLTRLIDFLRSDEGLALSTLMVLSVMIFHTGFTYYAVSQVDTTAKMIMYGLLAVLFSISVDMAILIFTLRGTTVKIWNWRFPMGYIFSIFQGVMNINHFQDLNGEITFTTGFISIILPIVIASYSEEIAKAKRNSYAKFEYSKEVESLRSEMLLKLSQFSDYAKAQIDLHYRTSEAGIQQGELSREAIQKALEDQSYKNGEQVDGMVRRMEEILKGNDYLKSRILSTDKKANAAVKTLLNFKTGASPENKKLYEVTDAHLTQ